MMRVYQRPDLQCVDEIGYLADFKMYKAGGY
jgi:hypothetical protein